MERAMTKKNQRLNLFWPLMGLLPGDDRNVRKRARSLVNFYHLQLKRVRSVVSAFDAFVPFGKDSSLIFYLYFTAHIEILIPATYFSVL
jgi:hypothetical protein